MGRLWTWKIPEAHEVIGLLDASFVAKSGKKTNSPSRISVR
jgi:hypothetical protein